MPLPPRTMVTFSYEREGNLLTPTSVSLRDATPAESEHPVGYGWLDHEEDGTLLLLLVIEGIEIRPMEVAIEHIGNHDEQWKQLARKILAEQMPDCEVAG